jgi:hypothetical protein
MLIRLSYAHGIPEATTNPATQERTGDEMPNTVLLRCSNLNGIFEIVE